MPDYAVVLGEVGDKDAEEDEAGELLVGVSEGMEGEG